MNLDEIFRNFQSDEFEIDNKNIEGIPVITTYRLKIFMLEFAQYFKVN